jgi:hypothetical protein
MAIETQICVVSNAADRSSTAPLAPAASAEPRLPSLQRPVVSVRADGPEEMADVPDAADTGTATAAPDADARDDMKPEPIAATRGERVRTNRTSC